MLQREPEFELLIDILVDQYNEDWFILKEKLRLLGFDNVDEDSIIFVRVNRRKRDKYISKFKRKAIRQNQKEKKRIQRIRKMFYEGT
jgi:hypothetical protein